MPTHLLLADATCGIRARLWSGSLNIKEYLRFAAFTLNGNVLKIKIIAVIHRHRRYFLFSRYQCLESGIHDLSQKTKEREKFKQRANRVNLKREIAQYHKPHTILILKRFQFIKCTVVAVNVHTRCEDTRAQIT